MPLILTEDYSNKRIFLGPDSVGVDVLPIDIYREHRERRRLFATNERRFFPMVSAFGNQPAGPSNTPRFTNLAAGVRLVPFDVSHQPLIRGNLISTADGLAGRDLFDRAPLSVGVEVDVDYQPPQVEIIEVNTGSALTPEQSTQLAAMHLILFADVSYDHTTAQMVWYQQGTNIEIMRKNVTGPGATANASAVQP